MNRAQALEIVGSKTPVRARTSANGEYVGLLVRVLGRHGPWRGEVKILGCSKPASFDYYRRRDGKGQRKGFRIGDVREFDGLSISIATKRDRVSAWSYLKALEADLERVKEMKKVAAKTNPDNVQLCDDIIKWRKEQIKEVGMPSKSKLKRADRILRPLPKRKPRPSKGEVVKVKVKGKVRKVRRKAR